MESDFLYALVTLFPLAAEWECIRTLLMPFALPCPGLGTLPHVFAPPPTAMAGAFSLKGCS